MSGWPPEARDTALLLASELVSNAVEHGAPPVTLVVHLPDATGRVLVEVQDADPHLPPRPAAQLSSSGERGRGLQIIDVLAADWGSRPCPPEPGKISWFELDPT